MYILYYICTVYVIFHLRYPVALSYVIYRLSSNKGRD